MQESLCVNMFLLSRRADSESRLSSVSSIFYLSPSLSVASSEHDSLVGMSNAWNEGKAYRYVAAVGAEVGAKYINKSFSIHYWLCAITAKSWPSCLFSAIRQYIPFYRWQRSPKRKTFRTFGVSLSCIATWIDDEEKMIQFHETILLP